MISEPKLTVNLCYEQAEEEKEAILIVDLYFKFFFYFQCIFSTFKFVFKLR